MKKSKVELSAQKQNELQKELNKIFSHIDDLKNNKTIEALKVLIESDPMIVNLSDSDGLTLLHIAAAVNNLELVKFLIEKEADIEATSKIEEFTPLGMAVFRGCAEIVEFLIEKGASSNVRIKEPVGDNHTREISLLDLDKYKKVAIFYDLSDTDQQECLAATLNNSATGEKEKYIEKLVSEEKDKNYARIEQYLQNSHVDREINSTLQQSDNRRMDGNYDARLFSIKERKTASDSDNLNALTKDMQLKCQI